jgi:hypothetical protein
VADQPSTGRTPPPALVAEARRFPGGWVYEIDGVFGPDEAVPPEAIRGAWSVGPDGTLTGDFEPNPNYRPTQDRPHRSPD